MKVAPALTAMAAIYTRGKQAYRAARILNLLRISCDEKIYTKPISHINKLPHIITISVIKTGEE